MHAHETRFAPMVQRAAMQASSMLSQPVRDMPVLTARQAARHLYCITRDLSAVEAWISQAQMAMAGRKGRRWRRVFGTCQIQMQHTTSPAS